MLLAVASVARGGRAGRGFGELRELEPIEVAQGYVDARSNGMG